MNMRPWKAFAAAALITGLAAGCSSSSPSSSSSAPSSSSPPSATGSANAADQTFVASALIVQCALTKGLMKPPTGLSIPPGQTAFVKGTKLVITAANGGAFNSWYNGIARTTVAGEYLEDWVQQTASSGKLPAAVCGTSVTTSELEKQVFANDPSVGDPW